MSAAEIPVEALADALGRPLAVDSGFRDATAPATDPANLLAALRAAGWDVASVADKGEPIYWDNADTEVCSCDPDDITSGYNEGEVVTILCGRILGKQFHVRMPSVDGAAMEQRVFGTKAEAQAWAEARRTELDAAEAAEREAAP